MFFKKFSLQWVSRCSEEFRWCQWGAKCYLSLLCWGGLFWCLCCIYLAHLRACPSHLFFFLFWSESNNLFPWGRETGDLCFPHGMLPQGPLNNQAVKTDRTLHCSFLPSLLSRLPQRLIFLDIWLSFIPRIPFYYLQLFIWPLRFPPTFLHDLFSVLGTHVRLCGGKDILSVEQSKEVSCPTPVIITDTGAENMFWSGE